MTVSLASYRVSPGEKPASSSKQNNMLTALENALNALPASQLVGFPSNAARYLDGSGNWSAPAGSAGAVPPSSIVGYPANPAVFLSGSGIWVAPSILQLAGLSGNALQFFNGGGAFSVPSVAQLAGFPSNANQYLRGDAAFAQPDVRQLAGFSGLATQYLDGSGAFSTPAGGGAGAGAVYLKTTARDVTSTSKSDLFNGEITIAANAMGATGMIKIFCGGDCQFSTGATIRMELKLGANVIWDSGVSDTITSSANRRAWAFQGVIAAMNSTSSQRASGLLLVNQSSPANVGDGTITSFPTAGHDQFGGAWHGANTATAMTAAQTLTLSITCGTAGSFRLQYARIEVG